MLYYIVVLFFIIILSGEMHGQFMATTLQGDTVNVTSNKYPVNVLIVSSYGSCHDCINSLAKNIVSSSILKDKRIKLSIVGNYGSSNLGCRSAWKDLSDLFGNSTPIYFYRDTEKFPKLTSTFPIKNIQWMHTPLILIFDSKSKNLLTISYDGFYDSKGNVRSEKFNQFEKSIKKILQGQLQ